VTLVNLTKAGLDATEAGTRFTDSDIAHGILALETDDQAMLASLLERVVAFGAKSEVDQ